MEILAIAGGLGTTGALIAVVVLALKLSGAGRRETAAVQLTAEVLAKAGDVAHDRDREKERADKAETQVADLMKRLLSTEAHVAELSAKLARQVIERVKAQPPSEDGAAAVNDLFSEPLPGKEK